MRQSAVLHASICYLMASLLRFAHVAQPFGYQKESVINPISIFHFRFPPTYFTAKAILKAKQLYNITTAKAERKGFVKQNLLFAFNFQNNCEANKLRTEQCITTVIFSLIPMRYPQPGGRTGGCLMPNLSLGITTRPFRLRNPIWHFIRIQIPLFPLPNKIGIKTAQAYRFPFSNIDAIL